MQKRQTGLKPMKKNVAGTSGRSALKPEIKKVTGIENDGAIDFTEVLILSGLLLILQSY